MTEDVQNGSTVQAVFDQHQVIATHLREKGELSFLITFESTFPKVMLLAAASNLEEQVKAAVTSFVKDQGASEELLSFVKNKAIERQYHSFFQWDGGNANQFFGLFGERFKQRMKEAVKGDQDLGQSIRDFLDLGNARNALVHGDYATAATDKSAGDVLVQYRSACNFVRKLEANLRS